MVALLRKAQMPTAALDPTPIPTAEPVTFNTVTVLF
jgi:hypothetical protein